MTDPQKEYLPCFVDLYWFEMTQKVRAEGSEYGERWDDGSDHDDVTKIYVRGDHKGIQYIYFDYVKNGQPKDGSIHGVAGKGFTQTFEINHLRNEHLESVEVYYGTESESIKALQFKTNFRASEIIGYDDHGTKNTLAVDGNKIIGFHGSSILNLKSLGAYFTPILAHTRHEARGGKAGQEWDDGYDHEGVTNISVRGGFEGIQFINFNYVKDGQPKHGSIHGLTGEGFTTQFEINHLDKEYLEMVEGYYDDVSQVIQGLQFKTNMKTFELMGYKKGKKFSLAANGKKIIGFHGYAEKNLNSLGAYFTTLTPPRLECKGGIGANRSSLWLWDDGAFDGVRKVYVTSIAAEIIIGIRFDYDQGGKAEKRVHGIVIVKDPDADGEEKEFVVDYPNEFITAVEGTFGGNKGNVKDTCITSLTFKTSKGTSKTFGDVHGKKQLVLERRGCALVGFHGWFNYKKLYALGAYYCPLPPSPSESDVEKLEAQGGDGGAYWDDGAKFDGVRKIYVGHCEIGVAFVKFLYGKENELVVGEDHGSKTFHEVKEFELEYPSEYLTLVEGCYDKLHGSASQVLLMLRFKTNKRNSQAFGIDTNSSFVLHKEGHKIVGFHGKSSNMLHQIGVHILPVTE